MATRFAAAAAIGVLLGGIDLCSKPDPCPVSVFVCSWCYFYVTFRANPLFLLHLCQVGCPIALLIVRLCADFRRILVVIPQPTEVYVVLQLARSIHPYKLA